MASLADNAARELFEAGGDNLAEKTKFHKYVAAFLWRKLGQGGAFGVVRGLEVALTTAAEKLGGRYVGIVTDGFLDGLGDAVRHELNRIKALEEDKRNAHLDQALGGTKATDSSDRKAAKDTSHNKPASDEPVSFFDALAALPAKQREKAEQYIGWLNETASDMVGAIVHFQTRPAFTRRVLGRVTGIDDVVLINLAVKELIVEEVLKIRKEEASKPPTFRERLNHTVHDFEGGVDAIFDEFGLDPAPDDTHGHPPDTHGHGGHTPPHLTIVHNNPASGVPAGTRGDNWNKLKNRLGGGH